MVNKLKKRLKSGNERLIGTWASMGSPNAIDVIGTTGLDFAIIDMEHGSMSFETVENMVRAAEANHISPLVRVSDGREQTLLRALETGVHSVMVPHVSTKETAENIVQFCKYFPNGKRGLSPYTRVHGFCHDNLAQSLAKENDNTLVGLLVEGQLGLSNLEEIVQVDGVDLIYLGLFDICQSVGLPGDITHPRVLDEIKRCGDLIRSKGVASGCMSTDIEFVKMLIGLDYQFIAYLNDAAALRKHYSDLVNML